MQLEAAPRSTDRPAAAVCFDSLNDSRKYRLGASRCHKSAFCARSLVANSGCIAQNLGETDDGRDRGGLALGYARWGTTVLRWTSETERTRKDKDRERPRINIRTAI